MYFQKIVVFTVGFISPALIFVQQRKIIWMNVHQIGFFLLKFRSVISDSFSGIIGLYWNESKSKEFTSFGKSVQQTISIFFIAHKQDTDLQCSKMTHSCVFLYFLIFLYYKSIAHEGIYQIQTFKKDSKLIFGMVLLILIGINRKK